MTNFLLNRGGAGKSITRAETAEAMMELIRPLIAIMRTYDRLSTNLDDAAVSDRIEAGQKRTRSDIAKLSEIILSAGAITPREAEPLTTSNDPDQLIRVLNEAERSFRDALEQSLTLKHHYRTIAILENLQRNTEDRIAFVRELAHQHNVPVG